MEGRTKYDEKFYKLYKEMQEIDGEYDDYKKSGNREAIKQLRGDKEKFMLFRLKHQADVVQKKLSKMKEAVRKIENGELRIEGKPVYFTAEQKEKEINRILLMRQSLLEKQVKIFEGKLGMEH